jgi:hypothetical protein
MSREIITLPLFVRSPLYITRTHPVPPDCDAACKAKGSDSCYLANQILSQAEKGGSDNPTTDQNTGQYWNFEDWDKFEARTLAAIPDYHCPNERSVQDALIQARSIIKQYIGKQS